MRTLALFAAVVLAATAAAQSVTLPAASPRGGVFQVVGITKISVDYGRPSVSGRPIWGQLVPYGFNNLGFGPATSAPWRAGADSNTVITFSDPVHVQGKPLAAGAYGLHMALDATGRVTVIFSKESTAWGSFFYDPAHDALRVETQWTDTAHRELLTYEFTEVTDRSAVLALAWEKKRIPVTLTVDTPALVVANLKRELATSKGFHYQAWVGASRYLVENNLELPLALTWAEHAVSAPFIGERNFNTLSHQAAVLEKLGRTAEAARIMDAALPLGTANNIHQYGRRMLTEKKPARALEVFRLNAKLHPDIWPVNYGLARGLSAVGDYPAALEALLRAQKQIPAGDTVNAAAIEKNVGKLRRGEDIN